MSTGSELGLREAAWTPSPLMTGQPGWFWVRRWVSGVNGGYHEAPKPAWWPVRECDQDLWWPVRLLLPPYEGR